MERVVSSVGATARAEPAASGPLVGVRVLELGGIGPGPFTGMVLADLGATVLRIDRPGNAGYVPGADPDRDVLLRGRPGLAIDLKREPGRELAHTLADSADVLIDPFRPGVAERLGLGPEVLRATNPGLVYGRVTGWGQDGPLAQAAGHDINYVAVAGPLASIGRAGSPPAPPLNLVGDFGGGGMLLAFGVLAALLERARSGHGQIVDAAMVDGVALQFASIVAFRQMGLWRDARESNFLDGGAPYYDTYETADGGFVAVGAIEPHFYDALLRGVGLEPGEWPQDDRSRWPELSRLLATIFKRRPRADWERELGGTDACLAPVLGVDEAAAHPHNVARELYQRVDGLLQPAPAPRFSRTPGQIGRSPSEGRGSVREALTHWGLDPAEVDLLADNAGISAP